MGIFHSMLWAFITSINVYVHCLYEMQKKKKKKRRKYVG